MKGTSVLCFQKTQKLHSSRLVLLWNVPLGGVPVCTFEGFYNLTNPGDCILARRCSSCSHDQTLTKTRFISCSEKYLTLTWLLK